MRYRQFAISWLKATLLVLARIHVGSYVASTVGDNPFGLEMHKIRIELHRLHRQRLLGRGRPAKETLTRQKNCKLGHFGMVAPGYAILKHPNSTGIS